jgi:hypothetical protein
VRTVRHGHREVNKYTHLCGARGPRTPGTAGGQQIYTIMCGRRARTPGTPGGQQIYIIMWGPEAPYARDSGRSTSIHNYVGPAGPVLQRPREINKYTQLRGARGPHMPGTPGIQQIYAIMWGPGAPYARDPGRSTSIHIYVGPAGSVRQGPSTEIGSPAGFWPAGGPMSVLSRQHSGQNLARKADLRPGSTIA